MILKLIKAAGIKHIILGLIVLAVLSGTFGNLVSYLYLKDFSLNNLGLILVPVILFVKYKKEYSFRFSIWAVIGLLLFWLTGKYSFMFVSVFFIIFFVIEVLFGKLNEAASFVVLVITSFAKYAFDILGFSIRLGLTKFVSATYNMLGMANVVDGNSILFERHSYFVDSPCMGLKMVVTSYLILFLIISFKERSGKGNFGYVPIVLLSGINFLLVIGMNYVRIFLLILFDSAPETVSHEIIGIFSLVLFTVVPLFFIVNAFCRHNKKSIRVAENSSFHTKYRILWPSVLATLIVMMFLLNHVHFRAFSELRADSDIELTGFNHSTVQDNIQKYTCENAIVFIKPGVRFYEAGHNPMICWRGSGYKVINESIIEIDNKQVYFAKLNHNGSVLFATWWFDNGISKEIKQLNWRLNTLKGKGHYRIINIVSTSEESLYRETIALLNTNLFQ